MRNSFRPGQMVQVIEDRYPPEGATRVGAIGTVRAISSRGGLDVDVRLTEDCCLWFSHGELKLV